MNEVPEGMVANTAFVRWFTVGDLFDEPPPNVGRRATADAIALYAARDLYDGDELFTFYGSEYPRTWKAGTPRPAQAPNNFAPAREFPCKFKYR